jgi:hypothetical protein
MSQDNAEALSPLKLPAKFALGSVGKCGSCKWSDVFKTTDGKVDFNQRFCKFEPPKMLMVPVPQGVQFVSQFPCVGTNEKGCSKFAANLDS